MDDFKDLIEEIQGESLYSTGIDTLQVNLGYYCNQNCTHCHLECSPQRTEMMGWPVMEMVLSAAQSAQVKLVDVTGGAPELNPHFVRFIESLRDAGLSVQVRTNLTALTEPGNEELPAFFRDHGVRLAASLPCYTEENVSAQRGKGVYEKSIAAIKKLNAVGYGSDLKLPLDLVYNPLPPILPGPQSELESAYRERLADGFGVSFTRLLTITNVPIGRFGASLDRSARHAYFELLNASFNPQAVDGLMCRHQISVAWDGTLYDCDFNIALGLTVGHGYPDHIGDFDAEKLARRRIVFGSHCFACTAGAGSSCGGALVCDTPSTGASI